MKKKHNNAENGTKRQKAAASRAFCGLYTFEGGFENWCQSRFLIRQRGGINESF